MSLPKTEELCAAVDELAEHMKQRVRANSHKDGVEQDTPEWLWEKARVKAIKYRVNLVYPSPLMGPHLIRLVDTCNYLMMMRLAVLAETKGDNQ